MSVALAFHDYEVTFRFWLRNVRRRKHEVRWRRMSPRKAATFNATDQVLVDAAFADLEAARLAAVLASLTFRAECWPVLRRARSVVLL